MHTLNFSKFFLTMLSFQGHHDKIKRQKRGVKVPPSYVVYWLTYLTTYRQIYTVGTVRSWVQPGTITKAVLSWIQARFTIVPSKRLWDLTCQPGFIYQASRDINSFNIVKTNFMDKNFRLNVKHNTSLPRRKLFGHKIKTNFGKKCIIWMNIFILLSHSPGQVYFSSQVCPL